MPAQPPHYATPVLRAPSPASSVGTTYNPDATSLSDSESILPASEFHRKWEEKIFGTQIDIERAEYERNRGPLIEWGGVGPKTAAEEKLLHEHILISLRRRVALLEENESFEQTLLRGSRAGLTEQPSTSDVDVIMRSMMTSGGGGGGASTASTSTHTPTQTMNVRKGNYGNNDNDFNPETTSGSGSGSTTRKRTAKGKGRSRG